MRTRMMTRWMRVAMGLAITLALTLGGGPVETLSAQVMVIPFGAPGDLPVVGRWTADRATYIGVYRPSASTFYLRTRNAAGPPTRVIAFGIPGDIPLIGNWCPSVPSTSSAPAPDRPGVYRSSTRSVVFQYADKISTIRFGGPGDIPVAGDWWSKGVTAVGVYQTSDSTFVLGPGASSVIPFGASGDIPVVRHLSTGSLIGVYRPKTSSFFLSPSNTAPRSITVIPFGAPNDIPLLGDWTGTGTPKVGVYRPRENTFYLKTTFP